MSQQGLSPNPLGVSVARILNRDGRPVGTAFLAAPGRLLTATHVVNLAIGRDAASPDRPIGPSAVVELDFPLLKARKVLLATIDHWVPPGDGFPGDIAGLRLLDVVDLPVQPAPIVEPDSPFDLAATSLGFPRRGDAGVWSIVRLRGLQGTGWVQIDLDQVSQFPIEQGFSGAPVWDPQRGTVVGMVTHAWRGGRVQSAYMVPAEGLFAAWPKLRELARPPSPFPGLRAFSETDAPVFFGREDLVDQIAALSATSPIITVTGGSGVGKSSLLAAGVIPKLRKRADTLVVKCVPNEAQTPLRAVALALANALDPEAAAERQLDTAAHFAAEIEAARTAEVITSVLRERDRRRLILVVDQFEQVLASAEDQIAAFGRALEALTTTESRPCLVLGIRDDFLPSVAGSRHLAGLTARAYQIPVADLDTAELREVIEGPLRHLQTVHFEPQLIDRLIADVERQPGRMPLVQFALAKLWDRQRDGVVRYETYRELGDIRLMLSEYADGVWQGLSPTERDLARRLLSQLVHPISSDEHVFTRRIVTRTDVSAELWGIAGRLAGDRLVVVGEVERAPGNAEMAVELSHEALILHWATLAQIARENRNFRLWQDQLHHRANRWASRPHAADSGNRQRILHPRRPFRPRELETRVQLLSMGELREARHWRRRHSDLTDVELRYLAASRTHRTAVWTRITALIAIVSLLPLTLVAESNREREAIEHQRISERLAAQSLEAAAVDGPLAQLLAAAAWDVSETDDAWNAMTNAVDNPAIGLLDEAHGDDTKALDFSPDGSTLISGAGDGTLAIWDTGTWRSAPFAEQRRTSVTGVAFSPDGSVVAVASYDELLFWDMTADEQLALYQSGSSTGSFLEFNADGSRLVSYGGEGIVAVWSGPSFDHAESIDTGADLTDLALLPNGDELVTSDKAGWIRRWNLESGEAVAAFDYLEGNARTTETATPSLFGETGVASVAANPAVPEQLLTCSHEACDLRNWGEEARQSIPGATDLGTFSPDANLIAAQLDRGDIGVWHTSDRELQGILPCPDDMAAIVFSPDKSTVAAAVDGGVMLWDLNRLPLTETKRGFEHPDQVQFSPDGSQLIAVDTMGTQVWDAGEYPVAEYPDGEIPTAAIDPKGELVAYSTELPVTEIGPVTNGLAPYWTEQSTPDIEIMDLATGDLVQTIAQNSWTAMLDFSPDGRVLAISQQPSTISWTPPAEIGVKLWDIASDEQLAFLKEPEGRGFSHVDFSPDGSLIATTEADTGTVNVWQTESGIQRHALTGNNSDVYALAFSADGSLLVAGTSEGFSMWEVETGEHTELALGETDFDFTITARDFSFSPSGRYLAIGTTDAAIFIWDLKFQTIAAKIPADSSEAIVDFSPDGSYLAIGSASTRIVDLGFLDDPYRAICDQAGRALTEDEWETYLGEFSVGSLPICE